MDNTGISSTTKKRDLLSMTLPELQVLLSELGEQKYRAGQMFPQMHRGISPEEMTNISKATKQKLS